jgi:hypothetical protein
LNQKFSPALPHKYNSVISMEATELALLKDINFEREFTVPYSISITNLK